ncbi:PE-PPE domain-containing protein [Gordonia terrae]|uniref:PE-PPE domain-containing protein n=1 Tax=Gordonia terrae TaxID=2055 RepID=A0AAD0KF87_9ACTN|nr:PE-PPE domain-containing protein [Gordonia terrae]ANY25991.1 PE-PPE domain-containing protein [Gordonia terrae]AWO86734.1 PE-PPE domain-containing protein [Gordonia terrae]
MQKSVGVRAGQPGGASSTITVFVVGGTGESFEDDARTDVSGLLAGVADELDDRFVCRWVGYPASYGPAPAPGGMSFVDSVAIGARRLRAAIQTSTGSIALVGYSQGAVVIRTALADLDADGAPDSDRILGVGLVADPHQPPGAVPGCRGWGVAGPGVDLPVGLPVCWVGAAEDMICNAAADSLVRDIADLTGSMTFAGVGRWGRSAWKVLRTNDLQNARRTSVRPAQWRRDLARLTAAWREIRWYLPPRIRISGLWVSNAAGGRHTSYRSEPYRRTSVTDPASTGCQVIARWLQVQATFAAG